ncbi:MAG TPA: FixH family protein [Gemmatimonadales bacterium]|nr:FixH family protein [Gemmatimonadales bacterium]
MRRSIVQWMRDVTLVAGITLAAAALWTAEGKARSTATLTRLTDIPSHQERYRASLLPSAAPIALGEPQAWTLELRDAQGRPVEGAALALESWMPEEERVAAAQPRVAAELGGGRYRVEGLDFERGGWWNVKLAIAAPAAGRDSLAFNLVF